MIQDKIKFRGHITTSVFGPDGRPKKWTTGTLWESFAHTRIPLIKKIAMFARIIIGILFVKNEMVIHTHNIVTDEGDGLFADQMANTPARTKVDQTNGYIELGTAYSGTGAKTQHGCHTPTGSRQVMDTGYPRTKASWGLTGYTIIQYESTWAIGALSATINEAAIMNASTSGDSLAYGQISPAAVVTVYDNLQVLWEITCLGA